MSKSFNLVNPEREFESHLNPHPMTLSDSRLTSFENFEASPRAPMKLKVR